MEAVDTAKFEVPRLFSNRTVFQCREELSKKDENTVRGDNKFHDKLSIVKSRLQGLPAQVCGHCYYYRQNSCAIKLQYSRCPYYGPQSWIQHLHDHPN